MRTNTINMISSGAQNMASSWNSDPLYVGQAFGFSIQAVWTGVPVGTFKLQISNDAGNNEQSSNPSTANVTNWSDYTGSSQAISGAGNWAWDVTISAARWVRLVYTATSGTGSGTSVQLNPKG